MIRFSSRWDAARLPLNLALLTSGALVMFTGLLLQGGFHMGNHGSIDPRISVLGCCHAEWSRYHFFAILALSAFMLVHLLRHRSWYTSLRPRHFRGKKRQVMILSTLFLAVAVTGYLPWLIHVWGGDAMLRKLFIEIHDKLALPLSGYLIWHIVTRRAALFRLAPRKERHDIPGAARWKRSAV